MTDVRRLLGEATPLPWTWAQVNGHFARTPQQEADARYTLYAVNHLPDYEAAVDALEPLARIAEACDDLPRDIGATGIATAGGSLSWDELDAARAALHRLRGDA